MCAFGDLLLWQAILHIIFMLFFMMRMFFNWKMYKSWNSGPVGQIDWVFDTFDVMETYSSNGGNQLCKFVNFYPHKGNADQYDGQCGWAELSARRQPSLANAAHRKGTCEKPLPLSWFTGRVPGTEPWAGDWDGEGLRTQTQHREVSEVQESDVPSKGSERERNKPK